MSFIRNVNPAIVILVVVINAMLIMPVFLPNLSEIGMHDESWYINSGRMLLKGDFPSFASSPLSALFFTPIYLITKNSPFWLVLSCSIGRAVLFLMLWLSSLLIARQLRLALPIFMIFLVFITSALTNILQNPCDALFAALSGFAFWQALCFYNTRKEKHLLYSSLLLGLATLARQDGIILFVALLLISITIARSPKGIRYLVVPFLIIVGGYILLYSSLTGKLYLGSTNRAYYAFEQAQGVAYSHLYGSRNAYTEGQIEARKLYGTAQENKNSIFNAIRRNPGAFYDRVKQNISTFPKLLVRAYSYSDQCKGIKWFRNGLSLGLLILVICGLIKILRKKEYPLLLLFVLWPINLAVYFFTNFSYRYFLLPYFIVLGLASIGISTIFEFKLNGKKGIAAPILTLMVAMCMLVIMRGGCPGPKFRVLGRIPEEQAVVFLTKNLPSGAQVGSSSPGVVLCAKMRFVYISFDLRYIKSAQQLKNWLVCNKIKAIYVDKKLMNYEPELWQFINSQTPGLFDLGYSSDNQNVRILMVKDITI